jgi:hypothetical protein
VRGVEIAEAPRMEAGKTTVTVALRLVDGSPMGRVLDEGGAEHEFAGWLGFMAVIERAAAAAAAAGNGADPADDETRIRTDGPGS